MDRTKFNLENILYWAKRPLEMIKGQCRLPIEEKVPKWTILIMYVYCTISFIVYCCISRYTNSGNGNSGNEIKIGLVLILIMSSLFFSLMTYGVFLVITMNLIAIGIINTSKKTIINRIRNIGTLIPILVVIMSFVTGQYILTKICIVLAIIMNIAFLIIGKITERKQ
ncbi:MAG: hypothetical protein PHX70_00760 [Clostridium sp.]|nr:hypothetical protein [Clostridium sp.]